jgi:hypothetical protein
MACFQRRSAPADSRYHNGYRGPFNLAAFHAQLERALIISYILRRKIDRPDPYYQFYINCKEVAFGAAGMFLERFFSIPEITVESKNEDIDILSI